ncbi:MAG: xanthine dehydrogenase family protein molybdopterin-binding subunit [Gammaproteobacteria bacterium]|jgi:CO/xanthine dehydrogenase Mo-binding subunit|nr:xanthine dehydrogenase family protein molybdopterin-binding subunit [Gammaproteobacteria bacterium]MBK7522126.1 xanthine dehydrogenase family protein molybdopterin-binding subunit [Gammaproteobacteria bacterium]MBK7727401.1 xanthine dehydrogenase family protein molybdopterin-binding subunit [Gammaproteobacteria bacterium]MBP6050292.1 xanthine dehydrogenase family protein molybdopterin-binding subunit [Pseudomonadales bacterium]MBP6227034.1 xanthine dehydrogenase family protein molybdopterin-
MTTTIPTSLDQLPTTARRFVGKEVKRIEDRALVTGHAQFIDNFSLPDMLHCAVLRSPHPHARIVSVDTSRAAAHPGVHAVLSGADLERWCDPMITAPAGWGPYSLAVGKVRFVGEPVAAIAATSRYIAEDACELIDVEYELLAPTSDPYTALDPESALLYEENGSNLIQGRVFTWGDIDGVFAAADHEFSGKFRWNRVGANPMETFGCVCQWDLVENRLTCHGAYQTPSFMALGRAQTLRLQSNQVNVISHPQGGGFGGKGGPRGTDIAALLSRKAGGRPVKYIEDRVEYLLAGGGQSWDRHYDASLAVKADGTVTGFRVHLVDNQGASAEGYGTISVAKPLAAFTGCYRIEAAQYDMKLVTTNRAPSYPYRGYGPPPHNFVLESLMDIAARGLGLDPAELRRRNYIRPEQFPYTIPSGNEYDSGNYEATLDKVLEIADYRRLREEQASARAAGRLLGIGVVSTIEPGVFDWNAYRTVGVPGVGVPEGVSIGIDILGQITARVGFNLQGQGQYTIVAQLLADYFGVTMEEVRVVYADTDHAPPHFGPGGSRVGVAITGAVLGASAAIAEKLCAVAAVLLQVQPDQVELMDGCLRVKGVPGAQMPMAQVAGAMLARSDLLPPGMEANPSATSVWTAAGRTEPDDQGRCKSYLTAANACHVVLVEVDPGTGKTKILKYFIADDCGTRLNPASVEGQIQGGVAQGVGAALLEQYVYNENAQPLVSTFMDYLVPTINEVPMTTKAALVTPSPFAPLGAKGSGEGAMHTTPAAVVCAINDALAPLGVAVRETPASPQQVWSLIRAARAARDS